ncbi:hypothetical protein EV360DRAFT_89602 [Lentinula raphanica]|nr:hypothetical protein EV360DRAFT_89602 [Lentinula raphanica]
MNLPESVLLCLFPNGLVLSRQSAALDGGDEDEEDVYAVDFDPDCFQFIVSFFRNASESFYGTDIFPGLFSAQQHLLEGSHEFGNPPPSQNPLISKQAIIVLREELEYFSIPPKDGSVKINQNGIAGEALRNVNKENNVAEPHLIDMLCMSGFDREDEWGFWALEPSRCCISSIALVLLKTGITHHPGGDKVVEVDYQQRATAQKLLLFWRKSARKCWWDGLDIELPPSGDDGSRIIKLFDLLSIRCLATYDEPFDPPLYMDAFAGHIGCKGVFE